VGRRAEHRRGRGRKKEHRMEKRRGPSTSLFREGSATRGRPTPSLSAVVVLLHVLACDEEGWCGKERSEAAVEE